jgi:hypothetical protein
VSFPGYTTTILNAPDQECNLVIHSGQIASCNITNNDVGTPPLPPPAPKLTLVKTVVNNNGGTMQVSDFPLFINGTPAVSGTAYVQTANVLLTATETNKPGYTASVWGGACAANGTITLQPGDNKTCTITNSDVPTTVPPPTGICRITGGGSVFTATGIRVTHGFQLRAPATELPQSLEINWNNPSVKGPDEVSFHLTQLTSATCFDNPNIDAGNPDTPYDTFIATGVGTLKGVPGATIELVFTDAGEPGGIKPKNPTPDTATMMIRDEKGNVVLVVSGPLDQGNHQMH